ncbi:MAG: FixH family protein [Myxococcota bacterium]
MSKANGNHWPWLLAGLLLSGVAMNIAMVLRASNDPSFAVEEDYYQKAVNWDEYREQLRKSEALGWQFTLNPSLDETGHTFELGSPMS